MSTPHIHPGAFTTFPLLETTRLRLRAVLPSDAEQLFALYSDARIMRYRGAPLYVSADEAVEQINLWDAAFAAKTGLRWALTLKDTGAFIGTAGFHHIHHRHLRAELGYELDPALWNRGLMTEALQAITGWGFAQPGLHTIEANIAPDNLASKRVLEKLGFLQEAHFRENYYYEGWWDSVIYTLHQPK